MDGQKPPLLMTRINDIKAKLAELKALDQGLSVFGSARHKYRFHDPLSAEQIAQLEQKHEISLSEEYKAVLQELGNGGAGCGYGLESLSLDRVAPPYPGTAELLRNWEDPREVDVDMVETDEISGYIRLFNYGCSMEEGLIVTGPERGDIIFFDGDGRFEKTKNNSLLDRYDNWLDHNLAELKRVQQKLQDLPLQEVIDSEWEAQNFSVREMILSLIGAEPLQGGYSGNQLKAYLEEAYRRWESRSE